MAAQTGTTSTGTTTTGTTTTGTTTTGTTTTGTTTTGRTNRRADAGVIQLTGRDIDGLLLCGEHYGAPYDLLAAALRVPQGRLPAIAARWRRAGYAATGPAGPRARVVLADPGRDDRHRARFPRAAPGAGAAGAHPRRAGRPAVAGDRPGLVQRAGLVAFRTAAARRPARGRPAPGTCRTRRSTGPAFPAAAYAGQVWAVEVELTPKPIARTTRIMGGLLTTMQYAQVIYLTAPAALAVVTRAAASLPPGDRPGSRSGNCPRSAFLPGPPR